MMVHNFIKIEQLYEDEFDEWNIDEENDHGDDYPVAEVLNNDENGGQANAWRESIAIPMWDAYLIELQARGIPLP